MRKTSTRLGLLLPTLLLASCASISGFFDTPPPPPLKGERINVTQQAAVLQPTPGATEETYTMQPAEAFPDWSQAGGNGAHQPGQIALADKVIRAWSVATGGSSSEDARVLNAPVIASGRLFAINTEAKVTALDDRSGKQLWEVKLPVKPALAHAGGALAVQGDLLFITTGGGKVFALTASSGKKVWDVDLGVALRAAPAVEGSQVFVISQDNRTFALSATDGTLQWTHSGIESSLSLMHAAGPAVANGVVVSPYSSGELFTLRATDGRFVWQDTLSSPYTGQDPESTISSIGAPPVIADGLVYAVGLNGGLSAYAVASGQRFWKADITTSQMPWVAGNQIFVLTDKGELTALNRKDGAVRWVVDLNQGLPAKTKDAAKDRYWSGPVLAGGRLVVASSENDGKTGFALSLNPETGAHLALTDLGEGTSVPPVAADDGLYFLTDTGRVIAFRPATEGGGKATVGESTPSALGRLLHW